MSKDIAQHICLLVDKSGSMRDVREPVVRGINSFIEDRKNDDVTTFVSLDMIDYVATPIYSFLPTCSLTPLTLADYIPSGATAWCDCLQHLLPQKHALINQREYCNVQETTERHADRVVLTTIKTQYRLPRDQRVLVAFLTDGCDTMSSECDVDHIKFMITELTATGVVSFVYLGANQDAWEMAHAIGIPRWNSAQIPRNDVAGAMKTLSSLITSNPRAIGSTTLLKPVTSANGMLATELEPLVKRGRGRPRKVLAGVGS